MSEQISINEFLEGYFQLQNDVSEIKELLSELKKPAAPQNKLMTVSAVAQFLNLSKASIYRLVSEREIPYHKTGGKLYFIQNEILHWVKAGRQCKGIL